mmetsp:Transcript_12286/g.40330  ORF Transcript_12286/g.40330 Transcript_12286/m.40330 type:complete len:267 (+) Transcript_12286:192-992(+)
MSIAWLRRVTRDSLYHFLHEVWQGYYLTVPPRAGEGAVTHHIVGSGRSPVRLAQSRLLPPVLAGHTRIVCLSDVHERYHLADLPPGDVLIIAGDILTISRHFSREAALAKMRRFASWLRRRPHTKKLVIGGNHDVILQEIGFERAQALFEGCDYVEDGEVSFEGGCRAYATPHSRGTSANRAFQDRAAERLAAIPRNLDVLVTHGPLLDEELARFNPRVHVCGHIHQDHGVVEKAGGVTCVNAAFMGRKYTPTNHPIVIDLPHRRH